MIIIIRLYIHDKRFAWVNEFFLRARLSAHEATDSWVTRTATRVVPDGLENWGTKRFIFAAIFSKLNPLIEIAVLFQSQFQNQAVHHGRFRQGQCSAFATTHYEPHEWLIDFESNTNLLCLPGKQMNWFNDYDLLQMESSVVQRGHP